MIRLAFASRDSRPALLKFRTPNKIIVDLRRKYMVLSHPIPNVLIDHNPPPVPLPFSTTFPPIAPPSFENQWSIPVSVYGQQMILGSQDDRCLLSLTISPANYPNSDIPLNGWTPQYSLSLCPLSLPPLPPPMPQLTRLKCVQFRTVNTVQIPIQVKFRLNK